MYLCNIYKTSSVQFLMGSDIDFPAGGCLDESLRYNFREVIFMNELERTNGTRAY